MWVMLVLRSRFAATKRQQQDFEARIVDIITTSISRLMKRTCFRLPYKKSERVLIPTEYVRKQILNGAVLNLTEIVTQTLVPQPHPLVRCMDSEVNPKRRYNNIELREAATKRRGQDDRRRRSAITAFSICNAHVYSRASTKLGSKQ